MLYLDLGTYVECRMCGKLTFCDCSVAELPSFLSLFTFPQTHINIATRNSSASTLRLGGFEARQGALKYEIDFWATQKAAPA